MTILGENYYKYIERWAVHFVFYLLLHTGSNTSVHDMIGIFKDRENILYLMGLIFLLLSIPLF